MPNPLAAKIANVVIAVAICAAVVVALMVVLCMDPWGEKIASSLDEATDPLVPAKIDPALFDWRQVGSIPVEVPGPRALAVGLEGRLYVAGEKSLAMLAEDGTPLGEITLQGQPRCVAVGSDDHTHPGRIYVGTRDRVEVFDPQGQPQAVWSSLGEKALITSIALAEDDVFVADAGNRIVLRYDTDGKLINRIGERDERRRVPGFIITSDHFDLAVAPDGLLRVVNPRLLRVEAYTFDSHLETHWGKGSPTIEGFFGCCNPAHIAIFADGRVVTSEKGVNRVKVYSSSGQLQSVVAGPEQLGTRGDQPVSKIAVDHRGRVLVLDPVGRAIRVYGAKPDE